MPSWLKYLLLRTRGVKWNALIAQSWVLVRLMEPGHEVGQNSKSNLNGKAVCLETNKVLFSKEEVQGR